MNLTYPVMITLNEIKSFNLFSISWGKVLNAHGGANADMDKPFPLSSIIDSNGLADCLWVVSKKPELNNLALKFAVVCVDEVDHLLTDERLKTTLDVAWKHSDGLATDAVYAAATYSAYVAATYAADADAARSYQIEILRKTLNTGEINRKVKK